ncbi:MAG: hypothetical protein IPN33_05890 [Saprospiraceae bacterium]|nr:hypothetical protein [Saprospiraceae bacterium]
MPANYDFPVPTNPWWEVFPEQRVFDDLEPGVTLADFVAIKIGDINSSADAN